MPIKKLSGKRTPIKIEQTTLNKFLPKFNSQKINGLISDETGRSTYSVEYSYTLRMERDGTISIKETHCLRCGRRLVKNGHNPRIAILDRDLGKHEFRIQRKRCLRCGEIKPDYSKIAPKFGNYHENHKRRTRQHYMEGLMPSQIQRVFEIDFGIKISKTTIVNWVNMVAEPLREMLKETPVPSSGYWGYDEIHLRICKERIYAIDTVDVNTRFIPVAKITKNMGRSAGREVLMEVRRGRNLWINGLVKDYTANLGKLLRTRSFKHIIQQNCLTHVKWIVSAHIKAFAGLSIRSRKPVPKPWRWLLKRFYALINSKHETDAYIQLEIVRRTVERLKGKRIKELHTALRQLESWLPKIIAHQRNPLIPTTNNLLEAFHKKYTYYPSFKRSMMTPKGAQRVLDYRVFRHNYRRFPDYIREIESKYERWRSLMRESKFDHFLMGQANHFKHLFLKLDKWYNNYQQLWYNYLAKF
jgi:hypothetical protein